jgi:hypothetical protein
LGQAIENVINRPGFPAVDGLSGLPFNAKEGTKLVPSEKMLGALLAAFSPAPNSLKSMESATQHLLATLSSEKEQIEIAAQGYQMAAQNLNITQEHFGQAAAWGVGKAVGAGQPLKGASAPIVGEPLPSQFAHVIIDHFMPQQEEFLQNLAMLLFLNNMGAQFGNSLLDKMLGFGDAANNYNFNHFLRPAGDGNFSGSVADAIKQLQAEERQCAQDMKQNDEIAATITRQLAQIKQELDKQPPPTPKQKAILTKMQASLTSTLQSSNACYDQLHNLAHLLSTLKISAAPGISPDKEFTITDGASWQTDLGQDEGYVINGNPSQVPSGGLVKLQSQTQAFQQSYADQGQNLQMKLQMEMTGIQQEWTVVSTALQLLNQMYMSVAQAIYKG